VTIAGEGTLLLLTIIFKKKHDRRIAQTEFTMYPAAHNCCCQDATWIDELVMIALVEEVLALHVGTAPKDIIPLLILDSYQCHMMALVVHKIQELGVEVKHIPAGLH
jgi:hypothetical protein